MPRALVRNAALTLAVLLASATAAVAQKLSISPTIGVYIPTTELLRRRTARSSSRRLP